MRIGEPCYVHGYVDEIRNETVIVRNNGGYFGTVPGEIICGEMPEQRWIPVSERLPDEDIETGYGRHLSQEVLVTCVNHEDDDERFTDMAYRCDGKWLLCNPSDGDDGLPYWCEILAYMPLPEPYKGEK